VKTRRRRLIPSGSARERKRAVLRAQRRYRIKRKQVRQYGRRYYLRHRRHEMKQGVLALLHQRYGLLRDGHHALGVLAPRAWQREDGYWVVCVGRVREVRLHRAVMAVHTGRDLRRGEEVHHMDGNPSNNSPDNLTLCSDRQAHVQEHGAGSGIYVAGSRVAAYGVGPHVRRSVGRVVMEEVLGRKLRKNERAFHVNGDAGDNRPANLQVLTVSQMLRRVFARRREKHAREKEKCGGAGIAAKDLAGKRGAPGHAGSKRAGRCRD